MSTAFLRGARRSRFWPAVLLPVCSSFWSICVQAVPPHSSGRAARGPLPVEFDSEVVRIFVEEDSLRIEGLYRLVCRAATGVPPLFYPYPADSLLTGARTLLLQARAVGREWQTLPVGEIPGRPGVRWRLPEALGDTVEVRTIYRQGRLADYGRYIVTTTQAWGRPLRQARFEIHLPAGAIPVEFSFPFRPQHSGETVYYLFEAGSFMPDRDITFTWEP